MTVAPKAVAALAMRSSSVATTVEESWEHAWQRSQTCWSSGLPAIGWSGFPGKRVEAQRAGMMPMTLGFDVVSVTLLPGFFDVL